MTANGTAFHWLLYLAGSCILSAITFYQLLRFISCPNSMSLGSISNLNILPACKVITNFINSEKNQKYGDRVRRIIQKVRTDLTKMSLTCLVYWGILVYQTYNSMNKMCNRWKLYVLFLYPFLRQQLKKHVRV